MSELRHLSAGASSWSARKPPMLAMPSFFALIVQPSASANSSCAIASGVRSAYPSSRVLMNHAFSANRRAAEDVLRRAALVRGDDVPIAHDLPHGFLERVPRARAGVRLVTLHHPRPLVHGHRARTRVGEQVNEHLVGFQLKDVVVGGANGRGALGVGALPNGLDRLDAEGLDDGLVLHGGLWRGQRAGWTKPRGPHGTGTTDVSGCARRGRARRRGRPAPPRPPPPPASAPPPSSG